jgi:hypothetical protein
MSESTKGPGVSEARAAWGGASPAEVTSSAFAGRFGHWAFEAQSAPVKVVNAKTGAVMGYFVSAREFMEFARLRDRLPRAIHVSEMEPWMIEELKKPLPADYPELDHLMEDDE